MLWLCIHLPRLPLEALGLAAQAAPCAVTIRRGQQRWIVCADREDPALAVGADAGAAQALIPALRFVERKPRAERATLTGVAAAAYRYGQPVHFQIQENRAVGAAPCALVWVEIGASQKLFGGIAACIAQLGSDLDGLGHAHQFGVAPTLEGAALLARAGIRTVVSTLPQLQQQLSKLPASLLPLPAEALAALQGTGLSTVGAALSVPREAWARRFATESLNYLDRLMGRSPDPRRSWHPPQRFERRFELAGEVESTQALQFPLRRLLQELAHYLRARDTGVMEFELRYVHESGPPTLQLVRLMAATRDVARLWQVARERLERVQVMQPVQELELQARVFAEPDAPQYDLFDAHSQESNEWQQLVERLVARLGADAVRGLGLVAEHRPEYCSQSLRPGAEGDAATYARRPVWLLDPPQLLEPPPAVTGDAERIESGWWDGADASRDYYSTESGGARLWVYRERSSKKWFLHGLWA